VLCPRGGLYDSALSVKSYKKKPLLKLMRLLNIQKSITFHATNQREKAAIAKFFPASDIVVADNLPSANQPAFKTIEKQKGFVKCVFIARIVAIKNLLFLLNALDKVKSKVLLTIIGPAEELEYWEKCKKKIKGLGDNITVTYSGAKNNEEIIPVLQENHLFVLPTTGENFGHSIFEAFLVGRPVLISDQTPWRNLKRENIGWDLPLAEPDKFVDAIEQAAAWTQAEFDQKAFSAWNFARTYNEESQVKEQYLKLFS
jgi:glycosyltransferase involved in cell wall biosynthesis